MNMPMSGRDDHQFGRREGPPPGHEDMYGRGGQGDPDRLLKGPGGLGLPPQGLMPSNLVGVPPLATAAGLQPSALAHAMADTMPDLRELVMDQNKMAKFLEKNPSIIHQLLNLTPKPAGGVGGGGGGMNPPPGSGQSLPPPGRR
mmetsp:Transcript_25953/g.42585  ORF Transcript_25953/g.42585 Transcript_25953/m.42585 type:complete len:144 (-) Transcript_25953:115-546(-)